MNVARTTHVILDIVINHVIGHNKSLEKRREILGLSRRTSGNVDSLIVIDSYIIIVFIRVARDVRKTYGSHTMESLYVMTIIL